MTIMSGIAKFMVLSTGRKMPTIGLGTYQMKKDVLKEALDYALFIGYRHIDTALSYGNEREIGEVIASRINSGTLKRSDLFVTTKIPIVYLDYKDTIASADESLENLKLKYVDMLLIHHPCGNVNRGDGTMAPVNASGEREIFSYDTNETWRALEKVVSEYKAQQIGLSNFQPSGIRRIWNFATIKPSNLQLECQAYLQQMEIRALCQEMGIIVTAYAALGSICRPSSYSPSNPVLLDDPVINEIAKNINKTPGEVLLNFVAQLGIGVLVKSKTKERLETNLGIENWKLSPKDVERIKTLDRKIKYYTFYWSKKHPDFIPGEPY